MVFSHPHVSAKFCSQEYPSQARSPISMECVLLYLSPDCPSVIDFICFSSIHHGGLGHGHDPYVLGQ